MSDYISQFLDAMRRDGLGPANAADIQPGRAYYRLDTERTKAKKGSYGLTISDGFACGYYMSLRTGEKYSWHSKAGRDLSAAERTEIKARIKAEQERIAKEESQRHEAVAIKASNIWNRSSQTGNKAYLSKKQIGALGIRYIKSAIVVPMYADGKLYSLQFIGPDGDKKFLTGGRIKGCYYPLTTKDEPKSVILICEGYATGASIRYALPYPVAIAFNASNLIPVAQEMRKKYPDAHIVICADNDTETKINGELINIGRQKAEQAAVKVGGAVIWPELPDNTPADFNDLHIAQGLDAVRERISAALSRVQPTEPLPDIPSIPPVVGEGELITGPPPGAPLTDYEKEFASVDWKSSLICNAEGKTIKGSLHNMITMIQHNDTLKGVFRHNEFKNEIFICRCPPWEQEHKFNVHEISDNVITNCAAHCEQLHLAGDTNKILKAICVVAERDSFNPAKAYFEGLKWDNKERLKNWLVYYLGAEDDDPAYLAFIGKKWLTAAVKRVYHPGCKFDHVLVNEGTQAAGKSTSFEVLATFGQEAEKSYFTDNIKLNQIQDKDTILLLQGSIIVELAELVGFSKKDDDEIKGWITTKEDRCRRPYGRTVSYFPRQFVLCGTTNKNDYLKDPTGNRRYWPFKSGTIDIEALKADREQLWAEAVYWYKQGLYIGPDDDERKLAEAAQAKRLETDSWEDDVMNAVDGLGLIAQEGFKTEKIMREMGLNLRDRDRMARSRISGILQTNGFVSVTKRGDGKPQRVWVKTGARNDN